MSNYNEFILFVKTFFDLIFISFISIFGFEAIIGSITINLIIVSIFGSVLVSYFGFVTNEAMGFYAVALFGLILIYEKYGFKVVERAVWVCILLLIAFIIESQLNSFLVPLSLQKSYHSVFSFNLRSVGASLIAFSVSARLLIYLYMKLPIQSMYVRSGVAQMIAQTVDTLIFFIVGFAGNITTQILFQTIIAGLTIKFITILLTIPFLYFIKQRWNKEEAI